MKAFIDGQFKVICDSSVVGMRIKKSCYLLMGMINGIFGYWTNALLF